MSVQNTRDAADKAEHALHVARGAFAEAQERLADAKSEVERRRARLVEAAKTLRDAREAVRESWLTRDRAEANMLETIRDEDEPLIAAALQEETTREHA